MPRLIINADDFGLTLGVNRAVEELHRAHALTSATLMANGAAFDDAVAVAKRNPSLGVGCHVVLVDGSAVADGPTTLATNGKLRDSLLGFIRDVYLGRVTEADIEREAVAQIQRLQANGVHPTHVDTHKHTHLFPRVLRPVLRAAVACGVTAIRNPIEPGWSAGLARNATKRRIEVSLLRLFEKSFHTQPQIASGTIKTTRGCLGVSATGSLDAATLQSLLRALPEGEWELVTHPGYNDADLSTIRTRLKETRETERNALLQELPATTAELIRFNQL